MGGCRYATVRFLMNTMLNIFFSSIDVVNQDNLPKDGPLLVVGNHNNQFVDAMVMMRATGRTTSFVTAEKSMHRPVIGDVARAMNAVPVRRAQDEAKAGTGVVTSLDEDSRRIVVEGGSLVSECAQPGCSIVLKGVGVFQVETVVSDSEVTYAALAEDAEVAFDAFVPGCGFKVSPKISQREMFTSILDRLRKGGCIGIFPEGGSHDNTDLLPLKAGVAVMALMARADGIPVRIVCTGINYFGGHTFRSKVFVDVSEPLEVPEELVDMYKAGDKRAAGNALLELVEERLRRVLFLAPTYKELKALRTARRMYQNSTKLTASEYIALNNRFSEGYEVFKEDAEFQHLLQDIHLYIKFAFAQGLTDKEVAGLAPLGSCSTLLRAWVQLLYTLALWAVLTPIVLPGMLLSLPLTMRTGCVVRREMKKALAGSSVKVAARDVAASQKVIQSALLAPALTLLYSVIGLVVLAVAWPYKDEDSGLWHDFLVVNAWWLIPLFFFFLFPLYVFYFCIVLAEVLLRRGRHIPSYWLAITSACKKRHRNPAEMLRKDRKKLVVRVQTYIEREINKVPEWAGNRIISHEKLAARRSKATLELMEAGDLVPSLGNASLGTSQESLVTSDVPQSTSQ